MRLTLRNKQKILDTLGKETLDRIVTSIKLHEGFEPVEWDKYPILYVDNAYTDGKIAFYVVGGLFDVRILAFKEFIK